ncbi:hypothetical protein [Halomarina oriensis]|uniref:Uncharacterized protein n=1 Tax=Halomarina oriensis TaxID=671145 RepID=A0A6B0GP92_9EURY|nr:hypothetical protein [Halomarina oriensis]MWG36520.1 hypothetical protein [Halomarina oriensis]
MAYDFEVECPCGRTLRRRVDTGASGGAYIGCPACGHITWAWSTGPHEGHWWRGKRVPMGEWSE